MTRKPLGSLRPFALAATLLTVLAASTLGASQPPIFAVSTFQAAVSATSPGARGTAILEEKGSNQIFSVTINDLSGVSNGTSGSFGVFVTAANNTNTLAYLIGPLSLQGTNNTWVLKYEAVGTAPAQLSDTNRLGQLAVTNLEDLVGRYLLIANPGYTNVVNGVTNEVVYAVLFTRIPAFTTKAEAPHYYRKSPLIVPDVDPPNPHEKGWVKTLYTGSQGRSVFDLSAFHLSGGGTYSIFIEDPPFSSIMTNIGLLMISTNSGHTGTYNIDTRQGETLPFSSATVSNLSRRAIQIRDAFDEIHLEGIIP
ncbi:MAG: hypothetical protein ABSG14_05590 [Verrucomicrobiia bacterium]|jgi:hypothetical protein